MANRIQTTVDTSSIALRKLQATATYFSNKEYAWSIINRVITELQIKQPWETSFNDSSVCIKNVKKGYMVKITTESEVFVDLKLRNFEFKSEKYKCESMEAAASKLLEVMENLRTPAH